MEEEIWKDIPGYEDYYQASDQGNIKSKDRVASTKAGVIKPTKGKVLNLTIKSNLYLSVMFSVGAITKRHHAHRLVAQTFIPNPENKPEVNHIDGIKSNNRVQNLEWVTTKENRVHASLNNLTCKGEKSFQSKLTNNKVLAIKRLYRMNPKFNKLALSVKLGVRDTTIHKIIKGQRWKHIQLP